jgi:hypothetical protein
MGAPSTDHRDALQGALQELISAMSALNMEPEPIPGATGFLSETDAWAQHAMGHLVAVADLLIRAQRERDELIAQYEALARAP